MYQRYEILSEVIKEYRRFSAVGRQITVRLIPPSEINITLVNHFLASVNEPFEYVSQNVSDRDTVRIVVYNESNHSDRPIGLSFRQKYQLSGDVIWSEFDKVAHSNSRFNALYILAVVVHSVRMPIGFDRVVVKTKGRPLSVMARLKRSTTELERETVRPNGIIIAIAKVTNDPNYKAYPYYT
jgi:hypothetical protein